MTANVPSSLSETQLAELTKRGISADFADRLGVRSAQTPDDLPDNTPNYWAGHLPGMLFPWTTADNRTEWQFRPDNPIVFEPRGAGEKPSKPVKYVSRSKEDGFEPVLWVTKTGTDDGVRIFAEGTFQCIAAAEFAPADAWVIGMVGCRSWSSDGIPLDQLDIADGQTAVVALDADMATNLDVWNAGKALQIALYAAGATSVSFLEIPGGKNTGLDDVLGKQSQGKRAAYLARLIDSAKSEKFPKNREPKKKASDDDSAYFGDGGLKVRTLAIDLIGKHPMAITREEKVALYRNGVYGISGLSFIGAVGDALEEDSRPHHTKAVEEYLLGQLHNSGNMLPERIDVPLLNVRNGMLDLATGTLKEHDPSYMSSVQFPVEWDPDAQCPNYEKWVESIGIADQLDDLEESVSVMLDPSRTPSKAVFLFGPSRSGKSTYIRLLEAIAGGDNTTGVTLAQLSDDRFAAANVFGKALNVASEVRAGHIEDISLFKQMTGEDLIHANRKNGKQFGFRNKALFAFAANELPTVGEGSDAYVNRIKPFRFDRSFAGHEDPNIEVALKTEIQGILVRWVKAWQRLIERGEPLPTSISVRHDFEAQSDRIKQWVQEECIVTPADPKTELPAELCSTRDELHTRYDKWCEKAGFKAMGRNKLGARLKAIRGVVEVRRAGDRMETLNIGPKVKTGPAGDPWEDRQTPPSGGFRRVLNPSRNAQGNTQVGSPETPDSVSSVQGGDAPKTLRNPPGAGQPVAAFGFPLTFDDDGAQALGALLGTLPKPLPAYEPPTCPGCDRPESLVPTSPKLGGGFWYACKSCHLDTFVRN